MATASTPAVATPRRGLHIALWVVQILLGVAFTAAGALKGFQPYEEVITKVPWAKDVSAGMVKFIGISEFLGGLGLILPAALRIKPILTPIAGAALALVMVLAAGFHAMRSEWSGIIPNLVFGGLAAFVAWGRFKAAPIAERK